MLKILTLRINKGKSKNVSILAPTVKILKSVKLVGQEIIFWILLHAFVKILSLTTPKMFVPVVNSHVLTA
jgi:hypothetical protein